MLTSDSPYTPISGLRYNPGFVHIMNVHEGLKDGPQPSFNLSILAQVILTRAQLITCLLS